MEILNNILNQLSQVDSSVLIADTREDKALLFSLRSKIDKIINRSCNTNCNKKYVNTNNKPKEYPDRINQDRIRNVVVHGLHNYAAKEDTESLIRKFFKDELGIEPKIRESIKLERNSKTILVKLNSLEDRALIFRNCIKIKNSSRISIVEDLPRSEREKRRKLLPDLIKAKLQGMKAFFKRGKLIVLKDNQKTSLNEDKEAQKIDNASTSNKFTNIVEVNFKLEENRAQKEVSNPIMIENSVYENNDEIVGQRVQEIKSKMKELLSERERYIKKKSSTNNTRKINIIEEKMKSLKEEFLYIQEKVEETISKNKIVFGEIVAKMTARDMK